ncbi:MAG TPA: BON domain-containing protein [Anaerolineae bacterium]|jgi:hyperosmotically inducible protein|nr:BON domain-containing protein [Anaerolineae bacterium]
MQERAYLREEIEEAISREPRISGKIDIEVSGRQVRLSGVVATFEEKELAGEIAREFGPIELINDIVIESTRIIEDEDVLDAARRQIAQNPDLAHDIGIDRVAGGVVYLRGHASNVAEIADAAEMVAEAPGVRDVVSEVQISTDVTITDEDLVSGVMQALHAEPSIHEEFIEVAVQDGEVTLGGTVSKLDQKILAGNIAKRLPGVASVKNYLGVAEMPTSFDQAIENEVMKALEIEKINMVDVRVTVLDGVVHLDGTVDTYKQRDRARLIAEAVPGVRYVQNDLVIGFHAEPKAKKGPPHTVPREPGMG